MTTDIAERIKVDFGDKASEASELLKEATAKTGYLNHPRFALSQFLCRISL